MNISRNLRYSPVNWLIVDWSFNGQRFNDCGLPKPRPCIEPDDNPAPCLPLPIREAIDTYDWEIFLPEVIVGIEDPDEEIAANYVRSAAIEFCKGAKVLQREIVVQLQHGQDVYPVYPYAEEQIIGILGVRYDRHCCCNASRSLRHDGFLAFDDVHVALDTARNELHVRTHPYDWDCFREPLRLLVWSAPTENSCSYDKFLYEHFRKEITVGARYEYANAVHFRDAALMRSLANSVSAWQQAIILSKNKAVRRLPSAQRPFGSGIWDSSRCWR